MPNSSTTELCCINIHTFTQDAYTALLEPLHFHGGLGALVQEVLRQMSGLETSVGDDMHVRQIHVGQMHVRQRLSLLPPSVLLH
jgi:hypothetical protein